MIGSSRRWTKAFLNVHQIVLRAIDRVWPACRSCCSSQSHEDDITRQVVVRLRQDKVLRDAPVRMHIESQQEHVVATDGRQPAVAGYIDISILFFIGKNRPYLAMECKRLNVTGSDGFRRSLAREYVEEGMMRFVEEQYAADWPIGAMLGYVMDGDVPFAFSAVKAEIEKRAAALRCDGALKEVVPSSSFATTHQRAVHPIELRHCLLSLA